MRTFHPRDLLPVLFFATALALLRAGASDLAGHKLLVTSIRTGDTEVFIADPETGDMFNITRAPDSEERYPCWSPDGKRIAFISDRNSATNLYVCDVNGSNLRRIVTSPAVCYMPSWRRTGEGERIVFGLHGAKPEMASVRPDGTDLRVLGVGHDPTPSPDGELITYTGEVEGGTREHERFGDHKLCQRQRRDHQFQRAERHERALHLSCWQPNSDQHEQYSRFQTGFAGLRKHPQPKHSGDAGYEQQRGFWHRAGFSTGRPRRRTSRVHVAMRR